MTNNNGTTIVNVFGREEPLVNDDDVLEEEPRIGGSFATHVRHFLRRNERNVRRREIYWTKRIMVDELHQKFKIKGLCRN
ncbi:8497_t:CDS:2, partial [Funneliformis mosseae]